MAVGLLYTILRFGFVALLWLLVIGLAVVLRRDISLAATASTKTPTSRSRKASRQPEPKQSKPRKTKRGGRPRYLAFTGGALAGNRLKLDGQPILLGRSGDCTVPLQDSYASNRHARIYYRDGQWFIEDLNSTNGTYLGNNRLTTAQLLEPGMVVRNGQTTMELTR